MILHGTTPSHFTRKVRVVLQELGVPYEFKILPVTALMEIGASHFASNPLQQVPILEDGSHRLIDSDLICDYLFDRYGQGKAGVSYLPRTEDRFAHLQRLAIINGAMLSGVKLVRAARSQIPNFDQYPFFRQERESIAGSLAWLDRDLGSRNAYEAGQLTMVEITLQICLEWALFREMAPSLDPYPNLQRFAAHWAARPSFRNTHPALPPEEVRA